MSGKRICEMTESEILQHEILVNSVSEKSEYPQLKPTKSKTTISVPEMRAMLGLKKTESYWLVHKNYFNTIIVNDVMRIEVDSFERWYANQVKYKKVSGEPPGKELMERSYSAQDIAEMLKIPKSAVYDILKRENIPFIYVDYWKRIPKDVFLEWYAGQTRYRMVAERERDAEIEARTMTMPEMAKILGITRDKVYDILNSKKYKDMFEWEVVADRKRITKKSFEKWYKSQKKYKTVADYEKEKEEQLQIQKENEIKNQQQEWGELNYLIAPVNPSGESSFYTMEEASAKAKVSLSTFRRLLKKNTIPNIKAGKFYRFPKKEFDEWIQTCQKGEKHG